MRGKNSKLLRKVFQERKTYRRAKHAYSGSHLRERIKAKEDIQEILDSGKEIKYDTRREAKENHD